MLHWDDELNEFGRRLLRFLGESPDCLPALSMAQGRSPESRLRRAGATADRAGTPTFGVLQRWAGGGQNLKGEMQMIKVKRDEWGGQRKGAGRPALTEGQKTRSITVTLSERNIALLEQAGGSNRSEGVRRSLNALAEIARGAIVSPGQSPEKIATQVLRVLQMVREENLEFLQIIGTQQGRAEKAEDTLRQLSQ